jgi:hypothetical protein
MNRTLLLALLAAGLGAAVWFGVLNRPEGSRVLRENAFAWEDTARLQRIYLADLGEREILLERRPGGRWTVNGRFDARPDAVRTLLETVAQVEAKYPVAKAKYDLVVREIAGKHTKVELYTDGDKPVKVYYVGPPTTKDRGNFMQLEGARYPYVVHIPGLDGFVHTRYILDEDTWRDRAVFEVPPARVERLEVTYTLRPDSSWTLARSGEGYALSTSLPRYAERPVNDRAALAYLGHWRRLHCEYYLNDWPQRDSVLRTAPICTLSVTERGGTPQVCYLYSKPVSKRTKSQFDPFGNPLAVDRDKYYASWDGRRRFGVVQDFVFGKLFVGPSYFVQPEPPLP